MNEMRLVVLLAMGLLASGCNNGGDGGSDGLPLPPAQTVAPQLEKPVPEELTREICGMGVVNFPSLLDDGSLLAVSDYGYQSRIEMHPAADPNGVTVIYHRGHGEPGNDVAGHIKFLNDWGFNVALMDMPPGKHDGYRSLEHGLCAFVSPVFQLVNYLTAENQRVYMMGISGGGWTTVLAAAMDGRIERSYPVSGGLPYDLRVPGDWGDWEQWHLAEVADYRDLYAMARHQLAVQNRYDSCCFAGDAMLTVQAGENWSAVVDETHHGHIVSDWALQVIVTDMVEGV